MRLHQPAQTHTPRHTTAPRDTTTTAATLSHYSPAEAHVGRRGGTQRPRALVPAANIVGHWQGWYREEGPKGGFRQEGGGGEAKGGGGVEGDVGIGKKGRDEGRGSSATLPPANGSHPPKLSEERQNVETDSQRKRKRMDAHLPPPSSSFCISLTTYYKRERV
ncbi:hypothetical protein E2C01_007746 [Portunus trituberculatus]|uniref:Uncharacterized protein n=1 Tax=Portunus trituberculatus TaxID=210409 RepID=A0A5B7CYX5_PORTR|nr:hypothetical protein [Portunus trituberculatus]